jgi:hypothetical protein
MWAKVLSCSLACDTRSDVDWLVHQVRCWSEPSQLVNLDSRLKYLFALSISGRSDMNQSFFAHLLDSLVRYR